MATPLLDRLAQWLGTWRGASALADGRSGVFEVTISSHFDGNVLQVEARSWDGITGELISQGAGLWSLARTGKIENTMWTDKIGFCVLEETPDDPDVLSMEGPVSGNLRLTVSFRFEDDALLLSSSVAEGYASAGPRPRTFARMTRVGIKPMEVTDA
jgi:hypothetical protein